MMKKHRKSSALVLFIAIFAASCLALPSSARAFGKDSVLWFLEGEFLGGYSQIEGKDGLGSILSDWLVSPTLKLAERLHWINVYNGSYNRTSQVITQEEGGREADETQSHAVTTAFKYRLTDTWSLRPHFFTDWVFVKETQDESFGDGLYDYHNIGGGLESSWITSSSKEKEDEARLGFQFFKREYPNYQSLPFLFDPNGAAEVNEKDFYGSKANLSFDSRARNGWTWGLETISLYKDFTDKQTIDPNGIRTGDDRQDFAQYVNGTLSHALSSEFSFHLDGQFIVNFSNLDFYDTHNTLSPADDDFISDYYEYFSYTVKPSIVYRKALAEGKNLYASLGYNLNILYYPGRKVQDAAGRYQSANEEDFNHTFALRTSYPITNQISWVAVLNYTIANSNQDFEDYYLYTYNRWVAVTGLSFKF